MLWIFLSALAFGGAMIAMSLFGSDADDMTGGAHDAHHDMADTGLFAVFSLRNLTWASFAFGGIGLLAVLTHRGPITTWTSSLLAGFGTLFGVHLLFRALRRSEASSEALDALAVGTTAELVLPFNEDGVGVISFRAHGQLHEMPARRASDVQMMPSEHFTSCRIGWIENGVAIVQPAAQ
ncbi:MAG: hypothetical protein IBJ03_14830 [Gemmatimonadaceae bacterium]|nr:hypothetical protein [Gemmatimonadaceae bacterium]